MRLTLVTETYFPQVNGVSRTLHEVVRHLKGRGDSVQLIHPDYGVPTSGTDVFAVRSLKLPFYRDIHLPIPPFGKAHRAIDRFRPDLIHIATEATLGWSILRYARQRKIPVVSSFHTNFDQYSDHYGLGRLRGMIWRYLRWFHNETIETYVPSRTTIADLEARGFERLVLWPRGVDQDFFRPDRPARNAIREALGWTPEDVVIGYVSRIAPEKNVEYLASSLELVARERPKARALLVGDGPSRAELESRLGSFARFAGYQTGDSLADHYAACDLFAFTSQTETFGNVVLEAMSSGLPVVCLRAGGVADIVRDRETGRLIANGEPPRVFADALIALLDDERTRHDMGLAAREYARSQSWDVIMSELRSRYLNAIKG
jgi:glycosyltransferase involved in cell wall biosynthesis